MVEETDGPAGCGWGGVDEGMFPAPSDAADLMHFVATTGALPGGREVEDARRNCSPHAAAAGDQDDCSPQGEEGSTPGTDEEAVSPGYSKRYVDVLDGQELFPGEDPAPSPRQ